MVMTRENSLSETMNVKITGKGKDTIVLAHGFGADQSVWEKIVPILSEHYQVLVFDWCFSGTVKEADLFDPVKYSSYDAFADDLNRVLDENVLGSVIFVGHSMSGIIGCIASVKRPELFKRLVLVGSSPRYLNIDGYEGGFGREEIEQILLNIEMNYDNWVSYFTNLVVGPKDPNSVEVYSKSLLRMKPEVALPMAKTVFYCDQREILSKVTTPCTIVQTSHDVVVPNSVAYLMQEWIAGKATVEIIETNGHFPQLTAHEQLMDVLGRILGFDHDNQTRPLEM